MRRAYRSWHVYAQKGSIRMLNHSPCHVPLIPLLSFLVPIHSPPESQSTKSPPPGPATDPQSWPQTRGTPSNSLSPISSLTRPLHCMLSTWIHRTGHLTIISMVISMSFAVESGHLAQCPPYIQSRPSPSSPVTPWNVLWKKYPKTRFNRVSQIRLFVKNIGLGVR